MAEGLPSLRTPGAGIRDGLAPGRYPWPVMMAGGGLVTT
jgi:hypothetical protein